ncbi:MAG: hypothetical protein RLZ44_963, partial [Pseudomonadota bacterium]
MKLQPGLDKVETLVSRQDSAERRRLLQVKCELGQKLVRDNPGEYVSWWIAEDAFELPAPVIDKLRRAGPALQAFFRTANGLFQREPWIQRRLEKRWSPNYARLNRAQPDAVPWLPRPDVVLDRDWQPKFVELELTVCARYDTAAMAEQYGLDPRHGLVRNYAEHFKQHWPGKTLALLATPHPVWWYIIDEVVPFAARLRREGVDALALGGEELARLRFDGRQLLLRRDDGGEQPIHVIDRFIDIYEIAELLHPGMAPLLDAYVAGAVGSVNTCKQFLDEKEWLCLFWEPRLRDAWRSGLGDAHHALLRDMLPRTWRVLPGARIELPSGEAVPIEQVAELPVAQRAFVLKESGTSSTASGAQSLQILSELSGAQAREALQRRLRDQSRPYVIQEIVDSPRISFTALNPDADD